ncbi:MAG: hypothetical protein H6977_02185 [Gammaproteobacteria bacterium]|nr:hypothetical protein [Gammaproteobacteria bacterium]MCP5198792.1 hypothetical protein [Gammaproteobacteria bacterium]
MSERFFTDAELREMERRTVDRLTDAIEAGDSDKAKKLARRMYNEFLSMHDLYRNWITATLSEVGRRYGDEALDDVMVEGVRAWWQPITRAMPQDPESLPARIKMFAAGLHGHLQPLEISEDDDKIEIKMCPCGSGGRLIQEGKYEGDEAFLTIEKGQRMTYGRPDYPVYCAHEYAMERVDIEENGTPFVVVEPAARLGRDHCKMVVYKDPAKIPAEYYERIGLKKP